MTDDEFVARDYYKGKSTDWLKQYRDTLPETIDASIRANDPAAVAQCRMFNRIISQILRERGGGA